MKRLIKQLIKKIFNLYDEADLDIARVEEYLRAYEKGMKAGEEKALSTKYTPNEIRELLGLSRINEEVENETH